MNVSPTLQQVQDAALLQGVSAELAEQFWLHYEAQGWKRGNNQPVHNWRALMTLWLRDVHGLSAQAQATKAKNRVVHGPPKVCRECGKPGTSWIGGKCGACYNKELRV